MGNNPYIPPTKKELETQEAENKKIEAKIKAVASSAKRCLSSDLFADYKRKLIKAREGIIGLMKTNSEPDPVRYALVMKTLITKIETLDMLGDLIEEDSKRRL